MKFDEKRLDDFHEIILSKLIKFDKKDFVSKEQKEIFFGCIQHEIIKKLELFDTEELKYVLSGEMNVQGVNLMHLAARMELVELTGYILDRCDKDVRLQGLPTTNIGYQDNSLVTILEEKPKFCQKLLLDKYYKVSVKEDLLLYP